MVELYRQGRSLPQVAVEMHCSPGTVKKCLTGLGVKIRRARPLSEQIEIGRRFGRLTVTDLMMTARRDGPGLTLTALCSCQCGRSGLEKRASNLLSGTTTSCGCRPRIGADGPRWKGCGQLSGYAWAQITASARSRADRQKAHFEVTIEEAWQLFEAQGGRCALSGLPICFAETAEKKRQGQQTASLDRIDSRAGYTVGNLQWVHKDINKLKSDFQEGRFVELCKLVADYQAERLLHG